MDINYLQFNVQKCKFMLISRKNNQLMHPDLLLCGQPLQRVDIHKYLGLLVSSDLSWSDHVSSICSKARKLLGMLYRRFYTHSNSDALFRLYASSVLSPYRTGEIKALKDIQKFALCICRKTWDQSTFRIVLDSHTWGPTNLPGLVHYVCSRLYITCVIFHLMYCVSIM